MQKPVITIEQATKAREWVSKFATVNDEARQRMVERQALADAAERNEALVLLAEAGLSVDSALKVLKNILDAKPEGTPKYGDQIRAASVLLDFFKFATAPDPNASPETTRKVTIKFENCSPEELKFYATFDRLPTPEELETLKAARGLPALQGSHSAEGTEIAPASESHPPDNM